MQKERKDWGPFPILIIVAAAIAFWGGWFMGNTQVKAQEDSNTRSLVLNVELRLRYALSHGGETYEGHYWSDPSGAILRFQNHTTSMERLSQMSYEQRLDLEDILERAAYLVYTVRFDGQAGDPKTQETVAELKDLYYTYFEGLDGSQDPLADLLDRIEANKAQN